MQYQMITCGTYLSDITGRRKHLVLNIPKSNKLNKKSLKKLPQLLESCFPANSQKPVKLFFEDEARFGRINNLSKCWVNRKDRAIVNQQIIREYIYAYTTICPA